MKLGKFGISEMLNEYLEEHKGAKCDGFVVHKGKYYVIIDGVQFKISEKIYKVRKEFVRFVNGDNK